MNTLEELKARAAARIRRSRSQYPGDSIYPQKRAQEAEADLDRAIAVAEEQYEMLQRLGNPSWHLEILQERDQARADVRKFREFVDNCRLEYADELDGRDKLLADTAHYEEEK